MTSPVDAAQYRDVAILAGLNDEEIKHLLEGSESSEVAATQPVFRQGEDVDGFYILERGACIVRRKMQSGREVDLATLAPKAVFGEMGLLVTPMRPRSASVYATEPSLVRRITRDRFTRKVEEGHPSVAKVILNMARVLCDRVENLNREFSKLVEKMQGGGGKATKRTEELQTFKEQLYKEWAF